MAGCFAERLRAGDTLWGASVSTSPVFAEIYDQCGYDWLFIDAETLPMSAQAIQNIVSAGQHNQPVVRMNNDHESEIRQNLDMGAAGVIIPLVKSADQAARIVASAKYPPLGHRGLAGARAQNYGYGAADYIASANSETATIVMVEEADGLENVEAISAVEGLDGIFVGPGDLSLSLGCLGDHLNPAMQAAYERIGAAARDNGIAAGIYPSSREMFELCFRLGFRFFLGGLDTAWARTAATARLEEVRGWSEDPQ